jgi:hypothetical protein
LLLFLQKKKILFFSEEKNQRTFTFWRRVQGSGIWPAKIGRINGLQSAHGGWVVTLFASFSEEKEPKTRCSRAPAAKGLGRNRARS